MWQEKRGKAFLISSACHISSLFLIFYTTWLPRRCKVIMVVVVVMVTMAGDVDDDHHHHLFIIRHISIPDTKWRSREDVDLSPVISYEKKKNKTWRNRGECWEGGRNSSHLSIFAFRIYSKKRRPRISVAFGTKTFKTPPSIKRRIWDKNVNKRRDVVLIRGILYIN